MKKITLGAIAVLMAIGTVVFSQSHTTKKAKSCCDGGACCTPTASCCIIK